MAFRFKQFEVEDNRSAMKVGTDAVLLGSWVDTGTAGRILEVGTGCGVISLMLAQRSTAIIDAIDINANSVSQASENLARSPWPGRVRVINTSLQQFQEGHQGIYDLVVTNPPFFENSLKSPYLQRNISKHTSTLSYQELIHGAGLTLKAEGTFFLILPAGSSTPFMNLARIQGWHCHKLLQIIPRAQKDANRVLMALKRSRPLRMETENLTIRDVNGEYTSEYKRLTGDYYLEF